MNTGVNARMMVIEKPETGGGAYSVPDASSQSCPLPGQGRGEDFIVGIGQNDLRRAVAAIVRRWRGDVPAVVVVQDPNAIKDPAFRRGDDWRKAEGWYDGQRTIYVIASNVGNLQRGLQVLAHEAVGHYGVEGVLGREAWVKVVADVAAMRSNPNLSPKVRGAMDSAIRRHGKESPHTFARESLAILVGRGVKAGVLWSCLRETRATAQ